MQFRTTQILVKRNEPGGKTAQVWKMHVSADDIRKVYPKESAAMWAAHLGKKEWSPKHPDVKYWYDLDDLSDSIREVVLSYC